MGIQILVRLALKMIQDSQNIRMTTKNLTD